MRAAWLISFTAPEERATTLTPDGPVTTVTWRWSLRPKTGEPGVLPAVEIPWFDTTARAMRIATIPAIPFGYASFRDNQAGADRLAPRERAIGFGTLAAGILAGLAFGFAGVAARRGPEFGAALRRLSPYDPTRRALLRAGRSATLPPSAAPPSITSAAAAPSAVPSPAP